jgi:aspartyl-tRNA synthetase
MYVSDPQYQGWPSTDIQTLPIGYYPTLADESLDKILLDQNPSHVEFMITPAHLAKNLDIGSIAESSQVVRLAKPHL